MRMPERGDSLAATRITSLFPSRGGRRSSSDVRDGLARSHGPVPPHQRRVRLAIFIVLDEGVRQTGLLTQTRQVEVDHPGPGAGVDVLLAAFDGLALRGV